MSTTEMVSLQHDLLTDPHQNPNGKLAEKPHGTPDVILKSSASQQPPKMAPFPRYVAGESGRSADFFQHKLRGWCNDFRKRLIGGAYRCYISGDIPWDSSSNGRVSDMTIDCLRTVVGKPCIGPYYFFAMKNEWMDIHLVGGLVGIFFPIYWE